jgi:phosphoserine phosphatase
MKGKEIKLIFFDMDGVLFDSPGYEENSTWAILFHDLGISYENEKLKEKFLKGIFSTYMEWSEEACKVLKQYGLTRSKFMETINKRPLMNGARETTNDLNINCSECCYVGDGINDISIFREVGLSIAFNATKEEVRKSAKVAIDKKDLREILKYLLEK